MSGNTLPPRPAMPHSRSIQGWEQSEEVAKRLLDDMRSEEELAIKAKDNERTYGHLVAEAHRRGISVERPWEQEEEVYQRLHDELERLEAEEKKRRPQGVTGAPSGLGSINTGGGATTFLAGAVAPRHSPHATDEATDWQQDEEVFFRLADEMAKIEQQGGGGAAQAPGGPKWIPKARLKHTASEAELLHSPTWEQEQEFEVQQRLHSEMLLLESRADARLRGEVTSGASAADDKAAYDKLQQQLRALEATGVLMPQTDRLGMPRQMSRGSLLPMADSASGVHLRL